MPFVWLLQRWADPGGPLQLSWQFDLPNPDWITIQVRFLPKSARLTSACVFGAVGAAWRDRHRHAVERNRFLHDTAAQNEHLRRDRVPKQGRDQLGGECSRAYACVAIRTVFMFVVCVMLCSCPPLILLFIPCLSLPFFCFLSAAQVQDRVAQIRGLPPTDAELGGFDSVKPVCHKVVSQFHVVRFTRQLNTNDRFDAIIRRNAVTPMIYAWITGDKGTVCIFCSCSVSVCCLVCLDCSFSFPLT